MENTQESQMSCFPSLSMGKAWEKVVTIHGFSKNLNANSSKVVGT
jgi:hypothetical protein